LSLYAPQKQSVYIIGDFNNWEFSDDGFMNRSPDASRWWKQIGGLEPGREYVFQYLVDEQIRIADPYADKILDPWNDKYISNITYPDLIDYPSDKTNQPASVLQTAQTPFEWTAPPIERPAKEDLVIYELLVRDFIARHDYQTLIDTLSYLKSLGVNAIELMPVNEFEGNSSWGYNTAFHFAPDKYYGTKNDLKQFIDECHNNGIVVILDIVLNHVFGTSPFARLYWDATNNRPASNNPWLNPVAKHDYNVGYDINHESQATKNLVSRVVKYWMQEYNVDGYRFDLSKGFTQNNTLGHTDEWGMYDASRVAIWKNIGNIVWDSDEDFYMILEHFAENREEKELANYGFMLWGNHNHNFRQLVMGWSEDSDIAGISYKNRGWNSPHLIGYMESHDEERLMFSIKEWGNTKNKWYNIKGLDEAIKRIAGASAVFYSIPGPKMLWQFGELGYDYSIDFNGRTGEKPIRWDYQNHWMRRHLYDVTASLIKLRQEHEVFRTSDFTISSSAGLIKKVILRGSDMLVVVVANFDIYNQEVTPDFPSTGIWYEYFTGDSLNVESLTQEVLLGAGDYKFYTNKKLATPDVGLGNLPQSEIKASEWGIIRMVYPNPVTDQLFIELNLIKDDNIVVTLLTNTGKEITGYKKSFSSSTGEQHVTMDLSGLEKGMYLLKVTGSQGTEIQKVIKM
jgi:glycosidase